MAEEAKIVRIPKEKQKEHVVDIINHVSEILYYFFEENEELESEEQLEEFVLFVWDIAVLCMGSLNMRIVGETKDGKILAEISPVESVKQMLMEKSIGEEGESYYEDDIEETTSDGAEVDLGDWESIFTS